MPLEEFIIWVYCWVDDQVKDITQNHCLRLRGVAPAWSNAEVITLEIRGKFPGNDADQPIWKYFKNHWKSLWPWAPVANWVNRHRIYGQLNNCCNRNS